MKKMGAIAMGIRTQLSLIKAISTQMVTLINNPDTTAAVSRCPSQNSPC
jgi:hypothetical protein